MLLIADRQIRILYARLDPNALEMMPGFQVATDFPEQITFLVGNLKTFKILFGKMA
jgi:hypothetical protein